MEGEWGGERRVRGDFTVDSMGGRGRRGEWTVGTVGGMGRTGDGPM